MYMIIIFIYLFLLNLLVIHWFEKVNYNNTLKHELSPAKIYEHNLFDERSDVDINGAIWLLNLVYLLIRYIVSFLLYTS